MDLKIGGEGVKVTLIGWGDWVKCGKENIPFEDWTLAQYNLLYAISFWWSPEEMNSFSFTRAAGVGGLPQSDLQCTVTINIFGKPYIPPHWSMETSPLLYLTNTFSSWWNCVLNLGCHGCLRPCRRAPKQSFPNLHPDSPFPIFKTNSASSSRMHYTSSGTPTHTAGSMPPASSKRLAPSAISRSQALHRWGWLTTLLWFLTKSLDFPCLPRAFTFGNVYSWQAFAIRVSCFWKLVLGGVGSAWLHLHLIRTAHVVHESNQQARRALEESRWILYAVKG